MDIQSLREFCLSLPAVTEDVKWGKDLCFSVGGKMFCVTGLDGPFTLSFKVRDDEFDELTTRAGIVPAPYVARYKWVLVEDVQQISSRELLLNYVNQSYDLIKARLPRKTLKTLGLT